ncbi:MAG: DUF86 domain-containing protein [Endomicrobia bacterium]|nr:DUF86 domain-containing protein [Endomicrobiia bacterium]
MSKKDWKVFIEDIKEEIKNIQNFTKGITKEEFFNNLVIYYAVLKALENIGEAVKNIPKEIKSKFNEIEWKKISGLRDILIHQYFGIDKQIVWDIL